MRTLPGINYRRGFTGTGNGQRENGNRRRSSYNAFAPLVTVQVGARAFLHTA